MTEMIERIARILCGLAGGSAEPQDEPSAEQPASEPDWHSFVPVARTVLAALREPTAEMAAAGGEYFEEGADKQNRFAAAIVYGAMIEAGLGEAADRA
ncbi:hypothetical protein Q4F19_18635 [Sphingomonas sp. BIUV-7]|uniref:Uncharacterized protein n=1 Tax=Sphingomonas natans TaxID=3063330 RepID=A0ABT8YDI8_9SPHN|nr:hypothetical protein [Sphingomonas sp. BIUV-7]MDO6416409.1 hypothetical protein [Sphingomonas sp. BIUV-7]